VRNYGLACYCTSTGARLDDGGCEALIDGLKRKKNLTDVDLSSTVGREGALLLAEAVKGNTTLTSITLHGTRNRQQVLPHPMRSSPFVFALHAQIG